MKNLFVRWADGETAMFTVPDEFELLPNGADASPITPLAYKADDYELWVDTDGLKSVMLLGAGYGQPQQLPDASTSFNR